MINRINREVPIEIKPVHLKVNRLSIEDFVEKIESEEGFSFARLSDGGFFCLQGRKGYNCDGVVYTSEQARSLLSVIKDPTITHGITSIAIHAARAAAWLQEQNIDIEWYDADVMNKASDMGVLWPLVACLRKRKVIMVGPSHLALFQGFKIEKFVECHSSQAFEEVDELEMQIAYELKKTKANTVLISAGQGAAPTLVSRLHCSFPKVVVLDVGSLWDPYCGIFSRSGHKKMGTTGVERLRKANFGQEVSSW